MSHGDVPAYGLWFLVILFPGLHHLRVQLHQTANPSRLAFFWRLQRLHRGAVYRDVWFSADDLPALRLAASALSRHGFDVARCRTSMAHAVRFQRQSALGPLHIASDALILMGFILLSAAWNVLSRRSAGMLSLQPAPTPTSAIRSMSASSSSCLASCCSGRLFSRC